MGLHHSRKWLKLKLVADLVYSSMTSTKLFRRVDVTWTWKRIRNILFSASRPSIEQEEIDVVTNRSDVFTDKNGYDEQVHQQPEDDGQESQ